MLIGGTACDLLMSDEGLDFRATKDIDLVLIIEAVDAAFGRRFWEYVIAAGYEHCNKSTHEPHFTVSRTGLEHQLLAMTDFLFKMLHIQRCRLQLFKEMVL